MVESGYDAEESESGARGLMQLMPATAKMLGVDDCFDPRQSVNARVSFFKRLQKEFQGTAAYHQR